MIFVHHQTIVIHYEHSSLKYQVSFRPYTSWKNIDHFAFIKSSSVGWTIAFDESLLTWKYFQKGCSLHTVNSKLCYLCKFYDNSGCKREISLKPFFFLSAEFNKKKEDILYKLRSFKLSFSDCKCWLICSNFLFRIHNFSSLNTSIKTTFMVNKQH